MLPSDSELYERRARACGALPAAYLATGRLLLETAVGPRFLEATTVGGRIRWIDNPPGDPCAP
jgi:hypothetical protein